MKKEKHRDRASLRNTEKEREGGIRGRENGRVEERGRGEKSKKKKNEE